MSDDPRSMPLTESNQSSQSNWSSNEQISVKINANLDDPTSLLTHSSSPSPVLNVEHFPKSMNEQTSSRKTIQPSDSCEDTSLSNQENHQKRKSMENHLGEKKTLRPREKNKDASPIKIQSNLPSQGILLCPKVEPMKKKKKIAHHINANSEFLEDDAVLDSILFDDMQSVQNQWQQLMIYTMEKELHIQSSEEKKKLKMKKFTRTNDFFLAHQHLYDFDGMRHWSPTAP